MTDARLTVDALMSAASHPYSHFVIVSDDSGYLPLVSGLKDYGHKVTVVTLVCDGSLVTEAAHGWIQLKGQLKGEEQRSVRVSSGPSQRPPANVRFLPCLPCLAYIHECLVPSGMIILSTQAWSAVYLRCRC